MGECVFHSDRFVFEALVRDMRKAGFVTRAYAKVMAMAVCTCRKKDSHRRPLSTQEVLDAANHVSDSFNRQTGAASADAAFNLLEQLSPLAREMASSTALASKSQRRASGDDQQTPSSHDRLTVIVSQALRRGLDPAADVTAASLLREESDAARASMKASGRGATGGARRKTRVSQQDMVRNLLRKKKKKRPVVRTITLPLFGGCTRQLTNDRLVGPGFSRLGVKHRCILELDSKTTAKLMASNVATTVVKAWCPSHEALQSVTNTLVKLSREIQEPIDRAHKLRKFNKGLNKWSAHQNRQSALQTAKQYARNITAAENPTEYKAHLGFDFGTKVLHKPKNHDSQTKRKTPVLAEGHCLYCLLPFNDYKPGGNDVIKSKECRHHPGYVTSNNRWTCCDEECETKKPSNDVHAQNGCKTSNHCWRPHKKASRGVGEKACHYERIFISEAQSCH